MQKIFDIFSLSRGIVIYLFNFAISGNDILNLLRKPSKMNNSVQILRRKRLCQYFYYLKFILLFNRITLLDVPYASVYTDSRRYIFASCLVFYFYCSQKNLPIFPVFSNIWQIIIDLCIFLLTKTVFVNGVPLNCFNYLLIVFKL